MRSVFSEEMSVCSHTRTAWKPEAGGVNLIINLDSRDTGPKYKAALSNCGSKIPQISIIHFKMSVSPEFDPLSGLELVVAPRGAGKPAEATMRPIEGM